ncbi:MAG TPA: hypothetical protein IAB98_01735 [Candidatus Egerieimonas intestinavium]|jgi:tetracycline resistance efflux pump|uniref:Na+/H+ antiporter NhaC-like C-terminal domain-containing protein n=1 Tax=Candidatus Egerieimonas intestinavium TaxID=2840777 RepID=A0A9D1JEQ4_9FIRM|nr:hypothetical protein [Candidatus Egerieimonas intestinavium]
MEAFGPLSLLPVAVVILLALLTRRAALALITGTLVGLLLLHGLEFPQAGIALLYDVLSSDLAIWCVVVGSLFGGLTTLFRASGGVNGFSAFTEPLCSNGRRTLLATWLMGVVLFIDDWLCLLTTGTAMGPAADRNRVPREKLALLITVTGASIGTLVPVSSWGMFMSGQLVSVGLASAQESFSAYLSLLPVLFYPILALLCGLLWAAGILPMAGPMRRAVPREAAGAPCHPAGKGEKAAALNFLLPIALITLLTIVTHDILYGLFACLLLCAVLYLPQRKLSPRQYLDLLLAGSQEMLGLLLIILSAFALRDVNAQLGMPDFVISLVKGGIPPAFLPGAAFAVVTLLGFAAGNFWGICAIAFPVILPVAQALGADLTLTAGAIISATVASSNLCFFGSEVLVACKATQVNNIRYAQTALPLLLLPVFLTLLCYLAAGKLWG